MKKLILLILIVFGWAAAAHAGEPATLTSLLAVHSLSNAEASHGLPVSFEATVTCSNSGMAELLFVQDGDAAMYIQVNKSIELLPGDRVLIKGKTQDSFRPIVLADSITVLRHGLPPPSVPTDFDQLIRAERDCLRVSVRAVVRAVDPRLHFDQHIIALQMQGDGGEIDARVYGADPSAFNDMLDAEVEITGVAAGKFDDKMQQTGVLLHVATPGDVKVLKRAGSSPWSQPVTPMDDILHGYHVTNLTQRVHVRGTITYYQPGSAVVLQSGEHSLWILTRSYTPLRIGSLADVTGFPDIVGGFKSLTEAEIQDSQMMQPVSPAPVNWEQLAVSNNTPGGHHFDLTSIEGQVVMQVRETSQDEYVLVSNQHMFSAIYRHPAPASDPLLPPMKELAVGSRVRVTGICMPDGADPLNGPVGFNILLRSFDDIEVVAQPSLMNIRNLVLSVVLLLFIVAATGARGWVLERKVHQKTVALATRIEAEAEQERRTTQLEQARSEILEDINASHPLTEILNKIVAMVSSSLDGAPCWCEVADGGTMGNPPDEPHDLRIVRVEIEARSGPPLGTLYAGIEPTIPPEERENVALNNGSRLATLAIETLRLYSDLHRRSEIDTLTGILNRFSMHSRIDASIESAYQIARIFGLIYIDLDNFKPINDLYGHHVGDLYLQEVAARMKRQLRGGDVLARLGGDEFAALVAVVRNRSEIEHIVFRLDRCFEDAFVVEGHVLRGSASVGIALYPEDGTTRDELLNASDAAMYAAKSAKREAQEGCEPVEEELDGSPS